MGRFRHNMDHVLRITMAAAGGALILALAGRYEGGPGGERAEEKLKELGSEILREGFGVALRRSYPGAAYEQYRQQNQEEAAGGLAGWIKNADPRLRFGMERRQAERGPGDLDPSFAGYLESQRVAESSFLIFGGDEETGTDKADLAGEVTGLAEADNGEAGAGEEPGISPVGGLPQGTLAHHTAGDRAVVGTSYVLEQLADYDFLMKHFFSVHSSTTAGREEMEAKKLLGEDLSLEKDPENPQILIYHTHSQETFADYGPDNPKATVVGIGDYLTELLEAKGYNVIHNTQVYDLIGGELDRSKAYDYALKGITEILQQNPSIQVILDVHRDGVREDLHMVSEVNGKPTAPIMFFNGMSQTPEGPIEYLPNPYKEQNLAFSLQMQLDAAAYFPGFTRKIYLKGFRYNLHLRPRSALIEVGAQTNTYEEARNAMEPLAELLDMVLDPG